MAENFHMLDWLILAGYFAMLVAMGWLFRSHTPRNVREYFLGGNQMSFWVVAVSVLATSQSAATFLGGPDQGYRGDYTYLATNIGTMIAATFVARVFIPRFYAIKAATVYELLDIRYGKTAMRSSGAMYLVGRVFAGGSRLYLAAIAVSMILYSDIEPENIVSASLILTILGFSVTFIGGIRSVLWSDLVQFIIYASSAMAVLYFLWVTIPASGTDIMAALAGEEGGQNKLRLLNFDFSFQEPFALISVLSGMTLLSIASFAMDQDVTQRLLTCEDSDQGARSLILSVFLAIPLIWLFLSIGQLLHVFYDRPDLMGMAPGVVGVREFGGEKITIFMYYILNEMPAGLKGLVASGVIAAAVSTINSGLNSMSSVMIQDFYYPWHQARSQAPDSHYVLAGRVSMAIVGVALFGMAVLCYFWQRYTDMALLDFALSVMVFAYSGLLGVYFSALFTRRGSTRSVLAALTVGFLATLLQQSYVVDSFSLPESWKALAFSWQLCIGAIVSFLVCQIGKMPESSSLEAS